MDGRSCAAARDHLESWEFCIKESQPGRDIRNAAAKKKCPLTSFQVPPLYILGNKLTSAEIPSSLYMKCASGLDAYKNAYNNEHCGDDGELRIDDDQQLPRKKKKKQQKDVTPQVRNKRQAEREEIVKCQTDIMKTLHGLKANMGYLLDLEERSQFKHPYPSS